MAARKKSTPIPGQLSIFSTDMKYVRGDNGILYGYEIPVVLSGSLVSQYYLYAVDVHSYKNGRKRKSTQKNMGGADKYYNYMEEQPIGDKRFFTFYQLRNKGQSEDARYGNMIETIEAYFSSLLDDALKQEAQFFNRIKTEINKMFPDGGYDAKRMVTLKEALKYLLELESQPLNLAFWQPPQLTYNIMGPKTVDQIVIKPQINYSYKNTKALNELADYFQNKSKEYMPQIRKKIRQQLKIENEKHYTSFHQWYDVIPDSVIDEVMQDFLHSPQITGWLMETRAEIINNNLKEHPNWKQFKDNSVMQLHKPDWLYHDVALDHKSDLDTFHIVNTEVNMNGVSDLLKQIQTLLLRTDLNRFDYYHLNQILNHILIYLALVIKFGVTADRASVFVSYKDNKWNIKLLSEVLAENGLYLDKRQSDIYNLQQDNINYNFMEIQKKIRNTSVWYSKAKSKIPSSYKNI